MNIKWWLISTFLLLITTSCLTQGDEVTWEYTFPDGYVGWIAIQHNCPGGQPLNRRGDVIKVTFGADGLFCTSDTSFAWHGKQFAKNMSGMKIPVFGSSPPSQVYGVCCGSGYSASFPNSGGITEVDLILMWVGIPQPNAPRTNIDAIYEDMQRGRLRPIDW
ncbi:MAG: hypothetical protein HND46_20535 [Chloroflexi bacterium]|nr:hypothetical protein [Chloroflexota bacterium]